MITCAIQPRSVTQHACPVVRDAAKEQRSPADLLRICETSLTLQGKQLGSQNCLSAGDLMKQPSQEGVLTVLRPFKIGHVELTAGVEEAPDRTQRLGLLVTRRVMKHERRKHTWFDRSGGLSLTPCGTGTHSESAGLFRVRPSRTAAARESQNQHPSGRPRAAPQENSAVDRGKSATVATVAWC